MLFLFILLKYKTEDPVTKGDNFHRLYIPNAFTRHVTFSEKISRFCVVALQCCRFNIYFYSAIYRIILKNHFIKLKLIKSKYLLKHYSEIFVDFWIKASVKFATLVIFWITIIVYIANDYHLLICNSDYKSLQIKFSNLKLNKSYELNFSNWMKKSLPAWPTGEGRLRS